MIEIDGNHLSIKEVVSVAQKGTKVAINSQAREKIKRSHQRVQEIVQKGKPVYGINTGFGIFSDKKISSEDIKKLNRNLILSHAVGTGEDLPNEVVRAATLIRANTLANGHSGIRFEIVDNLVRLLNQGLTPCIPSQGSLGSSGDLAPLSHLALVISTDQHDLEEESGWAIINKKRMHGKKAMKAAGIERIILGPKEGLAITNGATFSAAIAALTIHQAAIVFSTAEVALAMSLESMLGFSAAYDERLHALRRQDGQSRVAERIRKLISGSTLLNKATKVQDAYSLRCAPQVHGPAWDTLNFVEGLITQEINAVTDNPLIFSSGEAISGGNFHGEVVGMAMDFLKIAMSEIGAISERRIYHLIDNKMNSGLPPMLVNTSETAGLNSGMMMPHYTAASLVLENQHLSTPDSTKSLPASGGQEDHNANAMTAARHAYQIAKNCAHIIATELYCATRALDLRMRDMPKMRMGDGVQKAHQLLRETVPLHPEDTLWGIEIDQVRELVIQGKFCSIN
jgi:histidine ammonia-lyase